MPTKKRRVGFIPRSNVLDLINKFSYESNLSNSKIINILVEEALYKRGLFDIKTGQVINEFKYFDNINKVKVGNFKKGFPNDFNNNFIVEENLNIKDLKEEPLDKEIYTKFLMFLQFQELMKKDDSE